VSIDEFRTEDWALAGFIMAHGHKPIRVTTDPREPTVIIFSADVRPIAATFTLKDKAVVEGYRAVCRFVRAESARRGSR
jgi:hypothetical protein